MNIIYARMQGYDWVSVPSDAVARELENLGHKVTIVEHIDYIPYAKYDFVWSPYESVTVLGDAISKILEIPHIAHVEWFPPWRISKECNAMEYGFTGKEPELKPDVFNNSINYYKHIGEAYLNADIKTLGGEAFVPYMAKFLNIDTSFITVRLPSIDTTTIEKVKKMYSPKRIPNRILTVARLVPNKRYDLMVKVMNKIEIPCEWVIIGDGPEADRIKQELNNDNINLTLMGPVWGWGRFYEMLKATVYLGGWTGMPPIEAALLGCEPIVICPKTTKEIPNCQLKELFRDVVPMFTDDFKRAAKKIEQYINKQTKKHYPDIVDKFRKGEMGVLPSSINAENIIKLVEKYLDK